LGDSVRIGFLLSQGGEFSFILFLAANVLSLLPTETTQILLTGIALTRAATLLIVFFLRNFQRS